VGQCSDDGDDATTARPGFSEHQTGLAIDIGALVLLSPFGFSPTGEAFNLTMEDVATSTAIALQAIGVEARSWQGWQVPVRTDGAHGKARVEAMKTLFSHQVMQNGVLLLASHNLCYAHSQDDLGVVLRAYDVAFAKLAEELATGKLEERLPCKAVEPIFKVR